MSAPPEATSGEATGLRTDERDPGDLGALLVLVVAASYLAFVAVGIVLFRGRPVVGGAAAVFAIALSRVLQWTVVAKAERRAAR